MPLRAGASPKQRVIEINQRMNALGRERRLTEALGLLPELRAQGLKPTAVTFNVLLSACTRCGDNARAAALLAEMRAAGLQPNLITYATVARGLSLGGELAQAEEVLADATAAGVPPNARVCTAFLRGCLVHGEVERVQPFVRRMAEAWAVPLEGPAAEYAARALCMGLRVEEAAELCPFAADAGPSPSSPSSSAAAAVAREEAPPDGSVACHLAFADAHAALLDWPKAQGALRRARARLASGLDAQLHGDADEAGGSGGGGGGSCGGGGGGAYTDAGLLSAFLRHREAEQRRELERLEGLAASAAAAATSAAGGKKKRKLSKDAGEAAAPSAEALQAHLTSLERVYGRVVLVTAATARLAAAPLDAAAAAARGLRPKLLRRWQLAALLVARLDRLGLGRLQRRCGADVSRSEKRLVRRARRAVSAKGHLRWPRRRVKAPPAAPPPRAHAPASLGSLQFPRELASSQIASLSSLAGPRSSATACRCGSRCARARATGPSRRRARSPAPTGWPARFVEIASTRPVPGCAPRPRPTWRCSAATRRSRCAATRAPRRAVYPTSARAHGPPLTARPHRRAHPGL